MLTIAEQLAGRYSTLVNQTYDRVDRVLDEAQARVYTADRLVSDSITAWVDVADAWLFPLTLIGARKYVVRFALSTTAVNAVETIPIPNLGPRVVITTDLIHDIAANPRIAQVKVGAQVTSGGGFLVVTLTGLAVPLNVGRYSGEVKEGIKTLASIYVDVT